MSDVSKSQFSESVPRAVENLQYLAALENELQEAVKKQLEADVKQHEEDQSPHPAEYTPNPPKPRSLAAAERRAARLGVSVAEIYHRDLCRMRGSAYPTSECLMPEEVEQYVKVDDLSKDRLSHVDSCTYCADLVAAALPNAECAEELLEEVRRLLPQVILETEATSQVERASRATLAGGNRRKAVTSLFEPLPVRAEARPVPASARAEQVVS